MLCRYAEWRYAYYYAECHYLSVVMLSVVAPPHEHNVWHFQTFLPMSYIWELGCPNPSKVEP